MTQSTSWLVEHAGKLYAAAAAVAGATAAWVTMKARVKILGDRFDEYIARDAKMHDDINARLDRQERLVAEQGTAIRLLQQDIRHLSGKLDHFLDEQAALDRAERYAAIHVEALRRAGVLKGDDKPGPGTP